MVNGAMGVQAVDRAFSVSIVILLGILCIVTYFGDRTAPNDPADLDSRLSELSHDIRKLETTEPSSYERLRTAIDALEKRIAAIERALHAEATASRPQGEAGKSPPSTMLGPSIHSVGSPLEELAAWQETYLDDVELPATLKEKIGVIDAHEAGQWTYGKFRTVVESIGLVEPEIWESSEARARLYEAFDLFVTHAQILIRRRENFLNSLMEEYTNAGAFFEVGIHESGSDLIANRPRGTVLFRQSPFDVGKKRIFVLPFEENPELLEFERMAQNAANRFMLEVSQIAETEQ